MGKGKKNKFKTQDNSSYERKVKSKDTKDGKKEPFIVLSFRNFDRNQGQSFEDWEKEKLLALAMDRLRGICEYTVAQVFTKQIITQYTKVDFPPNSAFYHPKHIPLDITWCSMHIQGKECIIGYFEDNIFHIVFLDKNHEFWKTEKKHT